MKNYWLQRREVKELSLTVDFKAIRDKYDTIKECCEDLYMAIHGVYQTYGGVRVDVSWIVGTIFDTRCMGFEPQVESQPRKLYAGFPMYECLSLKDGQIVVTLASGLKIMLQVENLPCI